MASTASKASVQNPNDDRASIQPLKARQNPIKSIPARPNSLGYTSMAWRLLRRSMGLLSGAC